MIATVTNFGNSLGVQFPKSLLNDIHFLENEDVEIFVKDERVIIARQEGKKHLTTKERIAAFFDTIEDVQL